MGKKLRVNIEGFGTVLVDKPSKYNKRTFADGVGEAVAGTLGLTMDRDRTSFHPVLGKGGYDWDHETQRANVREAHTPEVYYHESKLRFCLRWVRDHVLDFARGIRDQFHKGG